jgi:hypothetical protein
LLAAIESKEAVNQCNDKEREMLMMLLQWCFSAFCAYEEKQKVQKEQNVEIGLVGGFA